MPEPINTYAQTKREGEEIILNQGPRETIVLRPRGIFGPGDETLLPRLIKVMRKGPVPLVNDGKALIDVTHVDNVVLAVELALAKELALGEKIYNVSNGEPIEVREILSMVADRLSIPLKTINVPWPILKTAAWTMESLAKVTGKEPAITQYTASTLAFTQTLNISAIRKDLGYEPIVSVKEGIASLPLGEAC